MHLSCLGEISAGFRAHPLYTPMKKYNSICVGSFRRARQPFVKCGVIQRLFLQRSSVESPSWQFCRQISKFPALWKVSGQTSAPLQCCSPGGCFCGQACRVPSSPKCTQNGVQGLPTRGLADVPLPGISWSGVQSEKCSFRTLSTPPASLFRTCLETPTCLTSDRMWGSSRQEPAGTPFPIRRPIGHRRGHRGWWICGSRLT